MSQHFKEVAHAGKIESPAKGRRSGAGSQERRYAQVETEGRLERDGEIHEREAIEGVRRDEAQAASEEKGR